MKFAHGVLSLLLACVAGCGGGSDTIGGNDANGNADVDADADAQASADGQAEALAIRTTRFKALDTPASRSALLIQLDAEGAKGYRYLGDMTYGGAAIDTKANYVNDGASRYRYALLTAQGSVTKFLAQANAQGAKGYAFAGLDTRGVIYRKASTGDARFSYSMLAAESMVGATAARFLVQANAEGAKGRYYVGPLAVGARNVNLYQKDSTSRATYLYKTIAPAGTDAKQLAQLGSQGKLGYRLKTALYFGGDGGNRMLYVKDTRQASTFRYFALASQGSSKRFLAQANAQGAKGHGLIGDLVQPSGTIGTFYFSAGACTGLLCDSRSPFGL